MARRFRLLVTVAAMSGELGTSAVSRSTTGATGHHIRDLWHGGDPVDPNNILPVHPGAHKVFNDQYPACYDGKAPWNTVGPNLPYMDH